MTSTMAPRQGNEGALNLKHAWSEHNELVLDESIVRPGFAYNLARYFPSGSHTDKETCRELMEKIGMSSDPAGWYSTVGRVRTPPRPGSSCGVVNDRQSYTRNPELFYMTTNRREFGGMFGPPAANARPSTSKKFPSRDKKSLSTYQCEFSQKMVGKASPIRTGSASGYRRNNPHPSEAFMIWKFPSRFPSVIAYDPSPDAMNEVSQDQTKSTYQSDYTGIPQGVNISTAFESDLVPALYKPPHTLDSTSRYSYQSPVLKSDLSESLARYGCYKNKYKPAVGAVPTVVFNSPHIHLYGKTQYSRDYFDKSSGLKDSSKRNKPAPIPALHEYLKRASSKEKESLMKTLSKIAVKDKRDKHDPEWLSEWTGPV